MKNNLLHIMHLADSALPVGGYAYSNGLEFAVKSGIISNVDGLQRYLNEYVTQTICFDLSFVKSAYQAKSYTQLQNVSVVYNAMLLNSSIKKSGVVLGKNWIKLIYNLYSGNENEFWGKDLDADFPLVFGSMCKFIDLELEDVCSLYIFMMVRDQMSAIIRLGTLGPGRAHKIQHDILQKINIEFKTEQIPEYKLAYKSSYIMEVSQLSHNTLYTKLFQN